MAALLVIVQNLTHYLLCLSEDQPFNIANLSLGKWKYSVFLNFPSFFTFGFYFTLRQFISVLNTLCFFFWLCCFSFLSRSRFNCLPEKWQSMHVCYFFMCMILHFSCMFLNLNTFFQFEL